MIATKEKPILFSGPMIRALLDGRKTQTRRVIKNPQGAYPCHYSRTGWSVRHEDGDACTCKPITNPYGEAGDRLWVRETFYCDDYRYPDAPHDELLELIEYRASHECTNWEAGCPCNHDRGRSSWRPSIHMPRWASRITLEITEVRVERLQSISDAEKLAEGATDEVPFGTVWRKINTKPGIRWDDNPWVWAISFKVVNP